MNEPVGKFSLFSTPTPLRYQFFTSIRRQIWPIFDPSPLQIADVLNGWSLSSFASWILGASSEILGNASASHFTSGVVWNLLFFSNAWMNNFSIFNFVWFDERRIRSSFWGHHTQATRNVIVTYVVLIRKHFQFPAIKI